MKHKLFTHNIFLAAAVAVVFFLGSGVIFAQDWLMTKTEELKGEYGELVKKLQVTTDEDELIGILEQPGVDNEALFLKMLACKRLATHGSAKCIPALVKWLEDEKMNQYARFALEPLPGEEADEALWNATKTLKGKPLVGVIDSIAVRNNPKSDSLLNNLIMTKYARNEIDPEVAKAVTSALGYIASSETVNHFASDAKFKDVHKGFEREIADAAFHCAEIMLAKGQKEDALKIYQAIQKMDGIRDFQREAAVYHEILTLGEKGTERIVENLHSENDKLFLVAIKSVREVPQGETVTKTLLAELPKLDDPWRQSLLILALGDRCDDASKALSRAVIVEYAKTGNLVTRIAAVRAMKNLAAPSMAPVLTEIAAENNAELNAELLLTLSAIPGTPVDEAVVKLLDVQDVKAQLLGIKLIEERRILGALGKLKPLAQSSDAEIKRASLSALAEVGTLDDLAILVEVLAEAKTPEEIEANQWALNAACSRMPKEEVAKKVVEFLNKADLRMKPNLMEILMQIGGETAVSTVAELAWSPTLPLKNKATELLGKWRDPNDADRVADACLKLAKEEKDERFRLRGLRGYIRYARQFPMSEEKRLEMVGVYLSLATRAVDKELVFQAFTKYPSQKMLAAVLPLIEDAALREKACEAAVAVADKLPESSEATAAAMKKVLAVSSNAETKEKAQRVLNRQ